MNGRKHGNRSGHDEPARGKVATARYAIDARALFASIMDSWFTAQLLSTSTFIFLFDLV